jgi:hypothetical protein
VLSFAQHKGREGKRRGGSTWWVLIAGEETKESLSTWPREAAARLGARERETGVGKKEEGSGRKGKQTAKKKRTGENM